MLTNRKFGVELEVSDGGAAFREHGTTFRTDRDCSVNDDGLEFVSPILQGDDGIAVVSALCDYAAAHGWDCDESCGYHLHMDMRDVTNTQFRAIVLAYLLSESVWRGMCPNRKHNEFCQPMAVSSKQIEEMEFTSLIYHGESFATADYGRYCWCNMLAYDDHRTLEIRLHGGTVDKAAVVNWIKIHLTFVEAVKDRTFDEIKAMFMGRAPQAVADIAGASLCRYYNLFEPMAV
jgi:hypothetical protein